MSASNDDQLEQDPFALPIVRGKDRQLFPRIDPESGRDMARWRNRIDSAARPLCVSLWSGAGGLDLGLEQAGFDVAVAADRDAKACQTHGHNSQALVVCRDLSDPVETQEWLASLELPPIELLAGGFPCQPYSRAGQSKIRQLVRTNQRSETDEREAAWLSLVAAAAELRPNRIIAENVPDLARFNDGQQLRDIVKAIEELGYEVDFRIVAARHFGVPQHRERLIIQAAREGLGIRWPAAGARSEPTLQEGIGDLPVVQAGHQEDPMPYASRNEAPAWAEQGHDGHDASSLYDHIARDVRADDLMAFEQLPPGGTYLDIPPQLRRYDDAKFTDKYNRLEWDKPSRTITAHIARDGYWYIHPEQHRTLTIREAARLQTFPDWFLFAGFPSNRYVQIGNAVPPLLGRALGEALLSESSTESAMPAAARRLNEIAAEYWKPLSDWELVLQEVVLNGRSSDAKLAELAEAYPTPDAGELARGDDPRATAVKSAATALSSTGGKIPDAPAEVAEAFSCSTRTAELLVSLSRGGKPPRTSSTSRVAERVAGIKRGELRNGAWQVALARLTGFGSSPSVNQLVVDLSRTICTRESPKCGDCPLALSCSYAQDPSSEVDPRSRLAGMALSR